MTFEEWQKQEQVLGLDVSSISLCRSAYEAGKAASRRPRAIVQRVGNAWTIIKSGPSSDLSTQLIRGGFVTSVDAKEWARSNGYDV